MIPGLIDNEQVFQMGQEGVHLWNEVLRLMITAAKTCSSKRRRVIFREMDSKIKRMKKIFAKFDAAIDEAIKVETEEQHALYRKITHPIKNVPQE